MNWATLTLGEVAAFFGAAAAIALWLYLRQPRAIRLRVSTLRFWESAPSGSSSARRWKLRDTWPFAAQLLFLLLLIAALGNPRWGSASEGRSVALVIDAGAWSQTRPAGGAGSWIDGIHAQTLAVLDRLASDDRVVLLRADSDGAPILPFTMDRAALRGAVAGLQPSSVVSDIPRALAQGRAALAGGKRGLLVYIGPGLMDETQARALDEFRQSLASPTAAADQPSSAAAPPEFLVRLVGDASSLHNRGIAQLAVKRSPGASDEWSLLAQVKNYDTAPAKVVLSLSVAGHVFWQDHLVIAPGGTASASDQFTSRTGGLLQAEISPGDNLSADDRATIALPSSEPVSVAVITRRPAFATKMKAVLSANPYVTANFVRASENPSNNTDVAIYDGVAPAGSAAANSIAFLTAPQDTSPHRVRLSNWNTTHPVTRWIQSRDVTVRAAQDLQVQPSDAVLASSSGAAPEPLILAREQNGRRSLVVGFDPLDSNFTEEPAFPLLMAASVEWMTHPVEEQSAARFSGGIDLPESVSRIVAPSGREIFFAGGALDTYFFAPESGVYTIAAGNRSYSLPVNVPPLPTIRWVPMSSEIGSLPAEPTAIQQRELWRWLIALALVALWLEWMLFYFRRVRAQQHGIAASPSGGPSRGLRLVSFGASDDESDTARPKSVKTA